MSTKDFGLPRPLGDGLLLRWATTDDADALADFNLRIHSDNPDEPEMFLSYWTHDLMRGDHPTTQASDFTVVVDENEGGKIVSSMNLISQTWLYDGIQFGVGRPELVGTDANYRRRSLIRKQFEAIHAKSAARGEIVQAITGIPWYYRMFGYEMAADLGGGRTFNWHRRGNDKTVETEMYQIRAATPDDIPHLDTLYEAHNKGSLLSRLRDSTLWAYELSGPHADSPYARQLYMIETAVPDNAAAGPSEPVAYVEYRAWGNRFLIRELGVMPGHSWRPVCLFLTRHLKQKAERLNPDRDKKLEYIAFNLGTGHPAYTALGDQLDQQLNPYAWYLRVPDLPGFLGHIGPVLERRLADSVLVGHTGALRLNLYLSHIALEFKQGKLTAAAPYQPKNWEDGDALFPDLTFLQLLFGRRSYDALDQAYADCYALNPEAAVLLKILFPQQPSWVVGLG